MFDLRSVSLAAGEQHREQLPVTIAPFTLAGALYEAGPHTLDVRFAVTRLRNGWVFDAAFAVDVHGACHRCLEDAVVTLEIEASEFHAFRPEPGAEEEMTCEYLAEDTLDSDRMASDAVVLAMPVQVLCRPDCAGLCPTCGANRNAGSCGCVEPEVDERWGKLRDLLR